MEDQLREHLATAGKLVDLLPTLRIVADTLIGVYDAGGRLFTFGNGGSAADAQHLAAEFIGRYKRERRPLPAMALTVDPSVVSCIGNDYDFDEIFARQLQGFAHRGDMAIGFTTSGISRNVVRGLQVARQLGVHTVLFGGGDGGPAIDQADHALVVPSRETARIQEMHTLLLHLVSEQVDAWAAGEERVQ